MRRFTKFFLMLGVAMLTFAACDPTDLPPAEKPPVDEPPVDEPPVDEPAEATFEINVAEVHAASAITQVEPSDTEMFYVMYLEEVSYFQSGGIATSQELFDDDLLAFMRNAESNDMTIKEYMLHVNVVFQGVKRVQWNRVRPGVKSVLYVYDKI